MKRFPDTTPSPQEKKCVLGDGSFDLQRTMGVWLPTHDPKTRPYQSRFILSQISDFEGRFKGAESSHLLYLLFAVMDVGLVYPRFRTCYLIGGSLSAAVELPFSATGCFSLIPIITLTYWLLCTGVSNVDKTIMWLAHWDKILWMKILACQRSTWNVGIGSLPMPKTIGGSHPQQVAWLGEAYGTCPTPWIMGTMAVCSPPLLPTLQIWC